MVDGILRSPRGELKTSRDWDQFLRRLNDQIGYESGRAVINALTTLATRTGTDLDSILQMLTDSGRAEDQRFLPQVSAGNVLSLQNVNPLVASADATNASISAVADMLHAPRTSVDCGHKTTPEWGAAWGGLTATRTSVRLRA